jgi:acyl-CoA dehydrogenase
MNQSGGEESYAELREGVRALCRQFDSAYWQKVDESRGYPDDFVKALTQAGWLGALIPEEYGGSGLSVTEASIILEEISRSGAFAGAVHGQMYVMGSGPTCRKLRAASCACNPWR